MIRGVFVSTLVRARPRAVSSAFVSMPSSAVRLTPQVPSPRATTRVSTSFPTCISSVRFYTTHDPPVANPEERPRGYSIDRNKKKNPREWDESLASRSEAIVKADRSPDRDMRTLQEETVERLSKHKHVEKHKREGVSAAGPKEQQQQRQEHKRDDDERIEDKTTDKTTTTVIRRVRVDSTQM
jgi:hypothetical protein